ncbi:MAG: thiamine pyrophosphate-binding protein [Hydrogenophaga sp.]|uniref:thiamine pyrophosphate-binding protein n=1 Tax=Hydrogenophaga sp. TaxID=1904254 RepID=UPI0026090AB5|nr:thiamine pyrophosphate-binding protein [Hydrogenophaga sp.]MCW5672297.1 thiamine pyrophosphate-binding protein [Hydrogenophaga sp.]
MTRNPDPGAPLPATATTTAPPLRLTGAQALVNVLLAEGVDTVFGIVGGKLSPLFHALSREPRIRFIGVRHEAAGPMMAAAVHAGTGRLAVAVGELGPGGLNLAAGLGVAFNNNLPLLAITTNQHRAAAYPHTGVFMDLDTVAVTRPLTKWNAVVNDARRMPELARRAFREALGGRRAGAWTFRRTCWASAGSALKCDGSSSLPGATAPRKGHARRRRRWTRGGAAAARLARRPLLVGGGGVVAAGAATALRARSPTA